MVASEICLRSISLLLLLATVLYLLTWITSTERSRETLNEDKRSSLEILFRHERSVEEDGCMGALSAGPSVRTLTSPGWPDQYPSNSDCNWLVIAEDPNTTISLRINSLSMEPDAKCRLDYLQVYLGPDRQSRTLGPFCGHVRDRVVETNTSQILIEFHSDIMYEDKGFSLDYFTSRQDGDCVDSKTEPSGTLRSPGYPDTYPDSTDCSTLITMEENRRVILVFDSVDLEFGDNCTFDYIQIFDGKTKDSPLLGQICQPSDASSFESSSSSLLVHFHSDDSVSRRGYRARYSSTDGERSPIGNCPWEAGESNGTISSPNYPENYPSSSNCSIWIAAPEGSAVAIVLDSMLLEMDTNCSFDFLLITEGRTEEHVMGRFCGLRSEPKELVSTGNEIRIRFQSDAYVEFSGFRLRYHFIAKEDRAVDAEDDFDDENTTFAFSARPENATLTEGSSATLHCRTKHATAKIRWLKGELFLAGSSPLPGLKLLPNNTLWIQRMGRALTGRYTCVAISPDGEELAAVAYVRLLSDGDQSCEVAFRKTPLDSDFEEGSFGHLECLSEEGAAALRWEKDGRPLQPGSHVTLLPNGYIFMERVRRTDAGLYTCVAEGANCTIRASARIRVIERVKIEDICGQSNLGMLPKKKLQSDHAKIIGGFDAPRGAYPWQVMLWDPSMGPFCGATLLNERWLATAAHCFVNDRDVRFDRVRVFLGKHDREGEEPGQVETGVASVTLHPAFDRRTFDHDLALVRTVDPVRFSSSIQPVCLGDRETGDRLLGGIGPRLGRVLGWGRLKEGGASPRYLQEIELPVVNQETCEASTDFAVTRNMFCAGYSQEVIGDACNGDSGGPFLMLHEGRWYLVGVVSWGEGCGKRNKYGFYTRIANHLAWINSVINS